MQNLDFIGQVHIKKDSLDSTNTFLKKILCSKKIENGTVVSTKYQEVGRGQRGNVWESKINKNILMSFVFFPTNMLADNQFIISKAVSLAILDLLSKYKKSVKIKWPNDIYIENSKVAGILIENSLKGSKISNSIIGIGLNINQKIFSNAISNPTSLIIETKKTYKVDKVLNKLVKHLNIRFNYLLLNDFNKINEDYLQNLYRINEFHKFETLNTVFEAKIKTIDKIGQLVLELKSGDIQTFGFKEIKFL